MNTKHYFLFVVLILFLNSCKKENQEIENLNETNPLFEDYKEFGLKTPVKSVLETTIKMLTTANDGEKSENSNVVENKTSVQYFFNEDGQLIEKKILHSNGILQEDNFYEGFENLTKSIRYQNGAIYGSTTIDRNSKNEIYTIKQFNKNDTLIEYEKYEYQNDLVSRKLKINSQDVILEKIIYEYNNSGLLTTETKYGRNNQLKVTKKISYDEAENVLQEININAENEVFLILKNEYNNLNELIQTNYLDGKQKIIRSEKKKYNPDGKLVLFFVTDADGNQVSTENTYNEANNIIKYDQMENEALTESLSYNYDANNNLVEIIDNIERKSVYNTQYEYTYDEKFNWTKRITRINGIEVETTEREINYN